MLHYIQENQTIKLLKNNRLIGYITYEKNTYPYLIEAYFACSKYKRRRYFKKLLQYWENEMKKMKYKRSYVVLKDDYFAKELDKLGYYYELKNQYHLKFLMEGGE